MEFTSVITDVYTKKGCHIQPMFSQYLGELYVFDFEIVTIHKYCIVLYLACVVRKMNTIVEAILA